ncbi:MAG: hypothetical protein AVDCRST_MAG53-1459 [uncultured Solirubrobacteraceae bacterium]|uniref:Uncharacterized protein n=1 Tax=uncultured Solirubrobacteraceae bacterium TaxID=1162706 RepID=A0A6J4S746_9ACTN|nr:MAG: hypothetical protein AVDCRST_MAG53-1459 [uncultured Solirubrobacteraceae bacterium]
MRRLRGSENTERFCGARAGGVDGKLEEPLELVTAEARQACWWRETWRAV